MSLAIARSRLLQPGTQNEDTMKMSCSPPVKGRCAPKSSSGDFGEFKIIDDHRAGKIVSLTGKLDKCGVISPKCDTQLNGLEKRQNRLLLSRQLGFVVLTTSAGIRAHEEAR
ncbi:hypothetical protein QTO34_013219 [Cnephaeus nilssonii]|uniref:40S ribosomal protein S15a n=1 Tax=Cnephaeus nilssonii TaxID=3371016 RepID=A0AA40LUM8_CNENI|nr:hypothetical protein QTO34_013219 [Eptesicus nilssonii]